jgi:uncharacterized protein (DUF2384 family)
VQNFDIVWQKAETVFGDKARAAVWLSTPKNLFDGMIPLEFVKKDQESLDRVIEVLTLIDHGYAS